MEPSASRYWVQSKGMKWHRQVWSGKQRWLLTLLCLVASFAYLTCQTKPGELTGTPVMSVTQVAQMPGTTRGHQVAAPAGQPSRSVGTLHLFVPAASTASPASAELMVSEPNAPPASTHDHVGHCPFCFCAAFALEASGVDVLFKAQPHDWLNDPVTVRPHLLALGHPDARAPPCI